MNLNENNILSLELVLADLKLIEGERVIVENFHTLSEDIERLEHIRAVLRNGKCDGCGQDFSEKDE